MDTSAPWAETLDQARLSISRTSTCCVASSVNGVVSGNFKNASAPSGWLAKVNKICNINEELSGELEHNVRYLVSKLGPHVPFYQSLNEGLGPSNELRVIT